MPLCNRVPAMASNIPTSPAQTPRRAVIGELSHFNESTNSAVAIRYVISSMFSLANMWLRFPRTAGFEHFQHAIGDHEAPNDVAGGGDDRDRSQNLCHVAPAFPGQDNGAHHGDRVQCVGQAHQRRVQQRGNPPDHFEADKRRQQENVETCNQVQLHQAPPPAGAPCSAGIEKNSLTRAFTISPSRVTSVSRMISSCRFTCSFPSFTRCSRKDVMLRANIWLA